MSSSLRIVQVVCTNAFAGVERYVATLASGLSQHGYEVTVVGGQGDRMRASVAPSGVEWRRGERAGAALLELVRRRRVDILHAHMTQAELAAVAGSIPLRATVVCTRHFAQRRGSSVAGRTMAQVIGPRLSAQVAISRYVAERIEGESVVVHPGTPECPEIVGPAQREPTVLVAQRLAPEKRTDLALRAWASSGLAQRGWKLWVAGDGSEREGLEALAAGLGVSDSCEFLGARADVEGFQRRAAILLAPRPDEPFGLSVVEAMAAGTPVVAAAGGGHLETVGQCPGAVLYPPSDTAGAGRLLAELAADPARRACYGEALRATHRRAFMVEPQVRATLDLYRAVLA